MSTITTSEIGQAVKIMFEDITPVQQAKVLTYLNTSAGLNESHQTIGDAVNAVEEQSCSEERLKTAIIAMRDGEYTSLPVEGESRPRSATVEVEKPEPAAVLATTTPRSVVPSDPRGKSKRQGMKEMWESMQEAMSQDDEEVEVIANRIFEERFKPSLVEAMNNGCFPDERIQDMIDNTPPKTDDEKMRVMIDESFRSGVGKVMAAEVRDGTKVVLPPLQPACPYFVETPIVEAIEYHLQSGQHIYIDGPSGAGKTYPIEQVLRKHGKRYVKVNFADGIRLSDLTTKQEIVVQDGKTQTKYIDGLLPFCMRHGLPLIGDEVDQLQPETTSIMNPTMDKFPGELLLPGSGERVTASPGFWVALTGNCLTDETGLYSGYKSSNALTNRCAGLKATYLEKKDEIKILEADGLDKTEARMIVNVMHELRDLYTSGGAVSQAPSTRQAVRISRYLQGKDVMGNDNPNLSPLSRDEAWHYAYFNFLPQAEYKEAIRRCMNEDSNLTERTA